MSRQAANEISANAEQIRVAFEALTDAELVKVRDAAFFRFQALGTRRHGRDADELVSEALISLLDGRRRWYPTRCPFFICFIGVIRSQAFHLRTGGAGDAFDALAPFQSARDSPSDLFEDLTSQLTVDSQLALEGKELERLIRNRFRDDPKAVLVLEALLDGKAAVEIRDSLGLSIKEYETDVKRVRRAVREIIKIINRGQL